jgi:hypothetical protein
MRANLSSMPNEINYIILNYLDPCSATSLGLACPSIYQPLKELYHHPIGLNQGFCTQSPPCDDEGFYEDDFSDHETSRYYTAFTICSHWISLGHLIQNWSGFAQYRFHNRFPNLFVIKSIYEDVSGSNEERGRLDDIGTGVSGLVSHITTPFVIEIRNFRVQPTGGRAGMGK